MTNKTYNFSISVYLLSADNYMFPQKPYRKRLAYKSKNLCLVEGKAQNLSDHEVNLAENPIMSDWGWTNNLVHSWSEMSSLALA